MAASIILPRLPWPSQPLQPSAIRDSKKLSPRERERLYPFIIDMCLDYCVAVIEAPVIDALNVFQASLQAMRRAVRGLRTVPDLVLVDGPWGLQSGIEERAIIHGDDLSLNIGAASIVAKVTRDAMMAGWERDWPGFSFAAHKGYGTAAHLAEIRRYGLTPLHRRSFAPCQQPVS